MIEIREIVTYGWEAAIRGMRNPKNSWDRSDSRFMNGPELGPNDLKLAIQLAKAGPVHGKYLRMIGVSMDITAPLYWWKEYDTYKVGTVANSCSTMHKIHSKEFGRADFSVEHMELRTLRLLDETIDLLNYYRNQFNKSRGTDKDAWWQMIQALPTCYNQKRTVALNYAVLGNMYEYRKDHKLDEWRLFCRMIEGLPYAGDLITGGQGQGTERG